MTVLQITNFRDCWSFCAEILGAFEIIWTTTFACYLLHAPLYLCWLSLFCFSLFWLFLIYPLITSCLLPQWNIGALGSPPMKYKMERFLFFFLLWNKSRTCLIHFLACKSLRRVFGQKNKLLAEKKRKTTTNCWLENNDELAWPPWTDF